MNKLIILFEYNYCIVWCNLTYHKWVGVLGY